MTAGIGHPRTLQGEAMRTRINSIPAALALAAAAALAGAGMAAAAAVSPAPSPGLLPPDAVVEGATFADWTGRWWNWALSQPVEPYLDPDGRICDVGQGGPVWFLAGTDGSFEAHRDCVVPEGKYLLVPVINMVQMTRADATALSRADCSGLLESASVNNDRLASAVVLLDGVPVRDVALYRVRTERCFRIESRNADAAADGYWVFLKPLPRGRHVITVGANYDAGNARGYGTMVQNFEYVVHVGGRTSLTVRESTLRSVEGTSGGRG
jgi:hypothetical protein